MAEPLSLKPLGFFLKKKSPRRGQVGTKRLRRDDCLATLRSNGRVRAVIEMILDHQATTDGRPDFDPTPLVANVNQPINDPQGAIGALSNPSRFRQNANEVRARAVASGHLGFVGPDLAIIDLEPRQSGHHVFDHVDPRLAALQRCTAGHFYAMGYVGGNSRTTVQVAADENDSRVNRRRPKFEPDIPTTPIAETFDHGGFG